MARTTSDTVALVLVGIVVAVVVPTACTVLYVTITRPDQDVSDAADALGRIVSVIIALLVGFIARDQMTTPPGSS